jgi:hypothetical protein
MWLPGPSMGSGGDAGVALTPQAYPRSDSKLMPFVGQEHIGPRTRVPRPRAMRGPPLFRPLMLWEYET